MTSRDLFHDVTSTQRHNRRRCVALGPRWVRHALRSPCELRRFDLGVRVTLVYVCVTLVCMCVTLVCVCCDLGVCVL